MDLKTAIRCKACSTPVDNKTASASGTVTCNQCGAALTVFSEDTVAPGQVAADASDDGLADLQIPGYEMKRQIGRGGMGFVFEARQKSLDRAVAIKVLAPHLGNDPQFAARFEAEAVALARLAHPNIVSIYERGRCGNRLYFVMEFVVGDGQGRPVDLKSVIAREPLGDDDAKRLIVQVIRALAVAHAEGIVHRDIKPGNILLDRHGNAKVADFGIACFSDTPDRERFTQPAAAMGTYDYMAPEQRSDAATADGRADVYSTATMLYEMLTGRVPAGAFQPPSVARSGVHPSWDAVIACGMHPLRDERYPTMTTFLAAVEPLAFDAEAEPPVRHTAVAKPSLLRCHECEQPVRDDALFCASCRTPQFLCCAACGARMRAAMNGCEQCGANLQSQRSYERFLRLGTAALTRAREAASVPNRIQAAQEAGVALARARKVAGDDDAVASLLAEANRLVETLATKSAREAIRAKRFGDAFTLLDAVLDVAPHRADAEQLRAKLTAERERAITEAKRLRDLGRPREAVRILGELAKHYADDASITELLREYEQKAIGLKAVVSETVPALMAEKKWCAVEVIVRQLRAEGAQVAGLDELAARMESIHGSISSALFQAESGIATENYPQVVRCTEAILEKVADHPRAIELRNLATEALDGLRDVVTRLKNSLGDGRYFVAHHASRDLSAGVRARATVVDLMRRTNAGIELANRYAALVVVTLVGAVTTTAAGFVAGGVRDGLGRALRPIEMGTGLFGYSWPAMLGLLVATASIGIVSAAGTAWVLRRPIGRSTLTVAGVGSAFFCLAALFFATGHRWDWPLQDLVERLGRSSPIPIPTFNALRTVAANAAVWIGYAFAIARCLSRVPDILGAPVWRPALVAGIAATVSALGTPMESSVTRSYVGSAILIASVTMLTGRAERRAYIMAAIGTGLLADGLAGLLEYEMKWLAPVLAIPALFVVQAGFTRPRSVAAWFTDAMLVFATVLASPFLQRPLLRVADTITLTPEAILVAWILAAGVLGCRWTSRKELDRRPHLADRFATRAWAVGPASTSSQQGRQEPHP